MLAEAKPPAAVMAQAHRIIAAARARPEQCVHYARLAAALIAAVGVMLPWLWLDGASEPLTGAGLAAFAFAGEWAEKWWMIRQNFIGAFNIAVMPTMAATATGVAVYREYRGQASLAWPLTALTAALLLLMTAADVTSSQRPVIAGLLLPGWGLALNITANAALAGHQAWLVIQQHRRARKTATGDAATPEAETQLPLID